VQLPKAAIDLEGGEPVDISRAAFVATSLLIMGARIAAETFL